MSRQQPNIKMRIVILGMFPVLLALAILARLFSLVIIDGPELRKKADGQLIKQMEIQADRGNIYSSDGKLLATTMPVFHVHMDPISVQDKLWTEEIDGLCAGLADLLPYRNKTQWYNYLSQARTKGNRYVLIGQNLSYNELTKLKKLPVYKHGRYKGGLIEEQQNFRKMPLGKLAERTIGYDHLLSQTGLEGAYSHYLAGKDGFKMMQKIAQGNYKPLHDGYLVEPEDGMDVVTTIDSRIQDVAHRELLRCLEFFEADHGSVVVMEVATGAIKAIANLGVNSKGYYYEKRNYAIWESTEPGSTFKLASLIALLEDGKVDTNTIVDTENGIWELYGQRVRDANVRNGHGGYGKAPLSVVFANSSNVGFARLTHELYSKEPARFVDRLYKLGLHKPIGTEIKGEGTPFIPRPGDAKWSGITLPWMAFGYETSFTPLQILNLYNAVANDGVMVKPHLVKEVRKRGRIVKTIQPEVINASLCSEQNLRKVQILLRKVVEEGSAKSLRNANFSMAGKTGTCQLEYWKKDGRPKYQASFAGYFPAESPQYSIIVVINQPNPLKGYYGSTVAAPVAAAIANVIFSEQPREFIAQNKEEKQEIIDFTSIEDLLQAEKLPDLVGLPGRQVIATLENMGYNAAIRGNGTVVAQFPEAGSRVRKSATISLVLQ